MNHVRIHGDPFADDREASALRSFLRTATASGMRCCLCLSAVRERPTGPGERAIALTDGVRTWTVATRLPPAEVAVLLQAAQQEVAATAPVVVFAPAEVRADAVRLVGLEWQQAASVIAASPVVSACELLQRVRAELRWAGVERQPHALSESELRRWLLVPGEGRRTTLVHVVDDPFVDGTDLVLDAFVRRPDPAMRLLLVMPGANAATARELCERAGEHTSHIDVVFDEFTPEHVEHAAAIVMPGRRFASTRRLVCALASGRPVCVSRFADNAVVLNGAMVAHLIGGRYVHEHAVRGAHFAPQPAAVQAAIAAALAEPDPAVSGARARRHVLAELVRGRPMARPPAVPKLGERRASVVLEGALFETSSTAELMIATASALVERGVVDLRLVPTGPFRQDLAWLRARAPQLESHLTANPERVDLWLSSGWPVRSVRPDARRWAVRVDWEYGALPSSMTPAVTEEADLVVVHSEHVYRAITAAGREHRSVRVVPHGVDAAMHEHAPPSPEILAFKGKRPAVLFCGGLVFRKGFDVFVHALLQARAAGHDFVAVVKSVGSDQHYGRFHLGGLLDRLQTTPGAPPVLSIADDLSREQLASVFTACDVLLHPYRGEGFCMPVLEARACGLPVLATQGGATEALMHGPGVRKIDSRRREVALPGAHVSQPWVLEPSAEHAAALLGEALADLESLRDAARQVAPAVRAAFSWQHAAEQIEAMAEQGRHLRGMRPGREPTVIVPQLSLSKGEVSEAGLPKGGVPVAAGS